MMTYEELGKALEEMDLYVEDVDGNPSVVLGYDDDSEKVEKLIDAYEPTKDDPYRISNIEILDDDDVYTCDKCGKRHVVPDYGPDDGYFGEYGYICGDCIENYDSVKDDLIEYAEDNPNFALKFSQVSQEYLVEHGWKPSEENYESGLYRHCTNTTPQNILRQHTEEYVVFVMTDCNPFETDWTYFTREA